MPWGRLKPMHVFISYKHEDRDFALLVKSEIEKAGYDAWIDDRLSAGESWVRNIDVALRDAFAVVLILTPQAHESRYVLYEWSFALGREIQVIPVLRKPIDEKELHQRLSDIQFLDFQHHEPWQALLDALRKAKERYLALQQVATEVQESEPQLKELPIDAATAVLLDNLNSRSPSIRLGAVKVLGATRERQAVTQLIHIAMDDDDFFVREAAVKALGKIGDQSALPVLHTILLSRESSNLRWSAAWALREIGSPSSVPAFCAALEDDDWEIRLASVGALGEIDHPDAIEGIIKALRDADADVRMEAVHACNVKRDPTLVKPLLPLLNDKAISAFFDNYPMDLKVKEVLENIGTEEALNAVAQYVARIRDSEGEHFIDDLPF